MKPGEKYIIEIDRVVKGPRDIAFVKGFNALVFDQYGLDHLRHAEEISDAYKRGLADGSGGAAKTRKELLEAAYQDGLDDAWSMAHQMYSEMTIGELRRIFEMPDERPDNIVMTIILKFPAAEVKKRLDAYQKEKAEIHVGDEVEVCNGVDRFVVTNINDQLGCEVHYEGVRRDGRTARAPKRIVAKTGRHFDVSAFVGKEEKE